MKQISKLTLGLLISILGEPEKQSGDEYFWQCPLCKDTGRDNLKFNVVKGILWCFANESHAPQIMEQILINANILKLKVFCHNLAYIVLFGGIFIVAIFAFIKHLFF